MSKKYIFLSIFSKITIFACVFCTISAWSDTTTCDIDFTPVTGNSWQNGTPTPTTPVAIESVGTKVGNKYQISVTAQGKNLFDGTITNWAYVGNPTEVSYSSSYRGITIPVEAGKTYTFSRQSLPATSNRFVYFFTTEYPYVGLPAKGVKSKSVTTMTETFTVPNDMKYVVFYFDINSNDISQTNMMVEQGSTATPYAPYGHSTTPVYLNAPLRKVGNYEDVLDYKNGTITRNVGVKVFDGTENWNTLGIEYPNSFYLSFSDAPTTRPIVLSSHYEYSTRPYSSGKNAIGWLANPANYININDLRFTVGTDFKAYLAAQYAAGTPVTVYYPLATPVVEQIENWSCPVPITDIKIATTKMVDEEFAQAEANLAATVQTIESVVSRTIAQTGQIATLQETKQTRPDESCPANMKCLLVQDEDGTPHWYPIIEP